MPSKIDLTNHRFGKLLVLEQDTQTKDSRIRWMVRCDCSTIFSIRSNNLRSAKVQSCLTCKRTPGEDKIIGRSFGIYTIIKFLGYEQQGKKQVGMWLGKDQTNNTKKLKTSDLYNKRGCNKEFLPAKEAAERVLYRKYNHSAIKRGHDFTLSFADFQKVIHQNCYYCNQSPNNILTHERYGELKYNGIDRVNNKMGYKVDNIQPSCIQCNKAKNSLSTTEFIIWINRLIEKMDQNEKD